MARRPRQSGIFPIAQRLSEGVTTPECGCRAPESGPITLCDRHRAMYGLPTDPGRSK